jgi:hypothetical protein
MISFTGCHVPGTVTKSQSGGSTMLHKLLLGAALSVALSTAAFAQARFGTDAETKAMLEKAVAAVKADKAKAIEMFNKGEGGFKFLYPFCFNTADGKVLAKQASALIGSDVRTLKDNVGNPAIEKVANAKYQRGQLEESGVVIVQAGDLKPSSA